jgi:hypothetical protein
VNWLNALVVIAMDGGLAYLTREYLKESGKYDDFYNLVDREWTAVFGNSTLNGENVDFALPKKLFPTDGERFSACKKIPPVPPPSRISNNFLMVST